MKTPNCPLGWIGRGYSSLLFHLGQNIYIGTIDGHVLHFSLDYSSLSSGSSHEESPLPLPLPLPQSPQLQPQPLFSLEQRTQVSPSNGRPIDTIVSVPTESRLLLLADHALLLLDMHTLAPIGYTTGMMGSSTNQSLPPSSSGSLSLSLRSAAISSLAANQMSSTYPFQFILGRRRCVQVWQLESNNNGGMDHLSLLLDIPTTDGATLVRQYGPSLLCWADYSHNYRLQSSPTPTPSIPLFSFSSVNPPLILIVSPSEFILAAQPSTGIIISSPRGEPTRGTIQWPSYPRALAHHHPYIISLHSSFIQIHNFFNQQLVQQITLPTSTTLLPKKSSLFFSLSPHTAVFPFEHSSTSTRSLLVMSSSSSMITTPSLYAAYALACKSTDAQIDLLLEAQRVREAIDLCMQIEEGEGIVGEQQASPRLISIYTRVAFLYFSQLQFPEALDYFQRARLVKKKGWK